MNLAVGMGGRPLAYLKFYFLRKVSGSYLGFLVELDEVLQLLFLWAKYRKTLRTWNVPGYFKHLRAVFHTKQDTFVCLLILEYFHLSFK